MKQGIYEENGELIYYKDDIPYHAGVIEIEGAIYYAGRHGRIAVGEHIVHREMSNGLLARGTYSFDVNGKLIEGSYIAPKKSSRKHKHHSKSNRKHKKSRLPHPSKKNIIWCIIAAVVVAALIIGAMWVDRIHRHNNSETPEPTPALGITTYLEEPLSLSPTFAEKLYTHEYGMAQLAGRFPYRQLELAYNITSDGTLLISEQDDFKHSMSFGVTADKHEVEIHNLKTNQTYYYRLETKDDTYEGSFKTAPGTRYIYISNVYNTRDIGGYTVRNGKSVKQGMIIRGSEMDGLVQANYYLKQEDIANVQAQFGFVYDMDLRESAVFTGTYTSPLGAEVHHMFYTAPMYGNIFGKSGQKALKAVFTDLAKPQNYPMYMHCTFGADRTGTVVFLLQGLLGMSENDMLREYQMTGFHLPEYATSNRMQPVIDGLQKYEGDTINQKIEAFLLRDVGVTSEEIAAIRALLLEE